MRITSLITLILMFFSFNTELIAQLELEFPLYASGFNSPVSMAHAGDDRLFIVEQPGTISIIDGEGNTLPEHFLDIQGRILSGGERGLLGLAFHPQYSENGYFYVNYTRTGDGATVISRFSVTDDSNIADPDSELIIMTIDQPFGNHNGGGLAFGPDGYLYIGMGDGGSGGDPQDNSQDPLTLLGKMLRIDIDNGDPYTIPEDNPFFGEDFHLDEIYALGLRNPWRFAFDSQNGDLWIADVGQNAWEEINRQEGGTPGGQNYGWRCYEGFEAFNLEDCQDISAYTMPVAVYGRGEGCSVSGGTVYRGSEIEGLLGAYIYADFCFDNIWTITTDSVGNYINEIITTSGINSTVGIFEGFDNELYLISISGNIYRISSQACDFNVEISFDSDSICEGEVVTISINTDISDPEVTLFYNGEVSQEGELEFEVTQSGEYYVLVEGEGCVLESDVITINEGESSNAEFSGLPETIFDNDDPITLTPEIAGGAFEGPGIVGDSFDPALAGVGVHTISYTVSDDGLCEATSTQDIEVLLSTSNNEKGIAGVNIKIKPNPVTGSLLRIDVTSSIQDELKVQIVDLSGKIVQNYAPINLVGSTNSIDLEIESIPTGMYLLKLSSENGQITERFVRR